MTIANLELQEDSSSSLDHLIVGHQLTLGENLSRIRQCIERGQRRGKTWRPPLRHSRSAEEQTVSTSTKIRCDGVTRSRKLTGTKKRLVLSPLLSLHSPCLISSIAMALNTIGTLMDSQSHPIQISPLNPGV